MADPITVHLAQGIVKPSFSVVLGVKLFCGGVQIFEIFTLCDLNNFDVLLGNTFFNVYEVDIFDNGSKMKVSAKVSFKLLNLNEDYNSPLVEIGINLVVKLAKELESFSFIILMSLRVFQGEPKPQGAR
jgi:hypothetical protein